MLIFNFYHVESKRLTILEVIMKETKKKKIGAKLSHRIRAGLGVY